MPYVTNESGVVVDEGSGKKVRFESETQAGTTVFTQAVYIADAATGSIISQSTGTQLVNVVGGTLNVDTTVGTIDSIQGGTLTVSAGTIGVSSGTLTIVSTVSSVAGGTLTISNGTVGISAGTVNIATVTSALGTVNVVQTVQTIVGGTLTSLVGGTVNSIQGGTLAVSTIQSAIGTINTIQTITGGSIAVTNTPSVSASGTIGISAGTITIISTVSSIAGGTITVNVPSVVSYAYNQLNGTATVKAGVGTLYTVMASGAGALVANVGTVVVRDGTATITVLCIPSGDTRQVGFTASGVSVGTLVLVVPSGTVDVTTLYQ